MIWLLLAAAVGGVYLASKSSKGGTRGGKWIDAVTYQDAQGRTWKRVFDSIPPPPEGYTDWIRPGTGTAAVRVFATTNPAVAIALDKV